MRMHDKVIARDHQRAVLARYILFLNINHAAEKCRKERRLSFAEGQWRGETRGDQLGHSVEYPALGGTY